MTAGTMRFKYRHFAIEDTKIQIDPLIWFYYNVTNEISLKMYFFQKCHYQRQKKIDAQGYISGYHKGILKYRIFFSRCARKYKMYNEVLGLKKKETDLCLKKEKRVFNRKSFQKGPARGLDKSGFYLLKKLGKPNSSWKQVFSICIQVNPPPTVSASRDHRSIP